MNLLSYVLYSLAGACWVAGVVFMAKAAHRRHLLRTAHELANGNRRLRRRMAGRVVRNPTPATTVVPARTMYGWVWIVVTGRKPRPGERPIQAHEEQIGWTWTRRGALRAKERVMAGNHTPRALVRNEHGSITDMVLMVVGLMVVSVIVSNLAADMSPGDILDWLINKAGEAWSYVTA